MKEEHDSIREGMNDKNYGKQLAMCGFPARTQGTNNNTCMDVFRYSPGYFPPLFLWMKQIMRRIRIRRAMAHMRPMNHPCVAISTCRLATAGTGESNTLCDQAAFSQWESGDH